MRELWVVAQDEYRRRVRQRIGLLGILAVPLLIIISTGVALLVNLGGGDSRPVGYVDQSGVLAGAVTPVLEEDEDPLEVRAYADPAAARAALEAGEIQAYYVLPPDYLQSREVQLYYLDQGPNAPTQSRFGRFIRANLLAGQPLAARSWALQGPELAIRSADGSRDWIPRSLGACISCR